MHRACASAMSQHPEIDAPTAAAAVLLPARLALVDALLDAALQGQRSGALADLVREHPRAARWLLRRHVALIRGTAGDAIGGAEWPRLAALTLRWLVTQLRPDAAGSFEAIDDAAWLDLSSWRPMLAMASHAGYLRVPDFPRRYRRRVGEAAIDNLCGLWDVGASTVYRTLERARRSMALVLMSAAPDAARCLSLRRFVLLDVQSRLGLADGAELRAWHHQQMERARVFQDPAAELWHAWQASDQAAFIHTLRRHATVLASAPETESLVQRIAPTLQTPRLQVDLWLARAALARTRNAAERELRAYEHARQLAQAAEDRLLLGIVYSELGKYYEARDADRAFASYQDSADFLRDLNPDATDAPALGQYALTLTRLAWLLVLRNDERSRALLDRAELLVPRLAAASEVTGMLAQVWAEYWRRAGKNGLALEYRYRALNIFERIGDRRSVLATTVNLVTMHGESGNHARALECAELVFAAAREGAVEPAMLASTRLNLGLAHVAHGELAAAMSEFHQALQLCLQVGLRLHAFRARHNLAEAYYLRFRDCGDPEDERQGDAQVAAALAAPESDSSPAAIDSTRQLKQEVLGDALKARSATEADRLLPSETATHLAEMNEVEVQRRILAVPAEPATHVRAHLAIARAYMAISTKEREAALSLVAGQGLRARFASEFDELQLTFHRELTREQQVANAWKQAAADIVDDAHRLPLIASLLRQGSVNKSRYAEVRNVSPATASKHLGLLTERGLLTQSGKGPSTRYELPL